MKKTIVGTAEQFKNLKALMDYGSNDLPTIIEKEKKKDPEILFVGDTVSWKGAWGTQPAEDVVVDHIEINCKNKCGTPVTEFPWSGINDRTVIVNLTNGSWAYGNQISKK